MGAANGGAANGMGGLAAELRDGILILTLDLPPSNALRPALRADLLAALRDKVPGCRAVVIAGAGVNFSSAVALEPDMAQPALAAVTDAVAGCPVPVVAALHGLVMGPGAELALAASARVASAGCRIAFPDIVLGLCPEAGTTRRLPALVGAETALRLLLTGRAVGLDEAAGIGLVDQASRLELLADAMTLAGRLAGGEALPRRENPAADWQAALHDARRAQPAAGPAAGRIIDCVEAGFLLPPAMAQAFERAAREDLEAVPKRRPCGRSPGPNFGPRPCRQPWRGRRGCRWTVWVWRAMRRGWSFWPARPCRGGCRSFGPRPRRTVWNGWGRAVAGWKRAWIWPGWHWRRCRFMQARPVPRPCVRWHRGRLW